MATVFAVFNISSPWSLAAYRASRNSGGLDETSRAHARCLLWIACWALADMAGCLVFTVLISQISKDSPPWPFIPLMVNRALELLGCFYGRLTALGPFELQHSLCQIPLSLLLAIIYGTNYEACSASAASKCFPLAVAPFTVFAEVTLAILAVHVVRWYVEQLLSNSGNQQVLVPIGGTHIAMRSAPYRGQPGSELERAERGDNLPVITKLKEPTAYVQVIQPGSDCTGVLALRLEGSQADSDGESTQRGGGSESSHTIPAYRTESEPGVDHHYGLSRARPQQLSGVRVVEARAHSADGSVDLETTTQASTDLEASSADDDGESMVLESGKQRQASGSSDSNAGDSAAVESSLRAPDSTTAGSASLPSPQAEEAASAQAEEMASGDAENRSARDIHVKSS